MSLGSSKLSIPGTLSSPVGRTGRRNLVSPQQKAVIAAELREKVWPLLASGAVKPVMDQSFPLAEAAKAHARMEASTHIGKIMLKVAD